ATPTRKSRGPLCTKLREPSSLPPSLLSVGLGTVRARGPWRRTLEQRKKAMLGFETLTACTSSSGVLSSVLGSLPAIAAAPVTLGSLLGAGLYDGRLFDKDIWVNLMFALRVTLCLGGALLLLAEVRARRMNIHIRERTRKRIALIMTVLAFGAYFDFGNEKVRYSEYYHRHELYHYYLGSKYSEELGYKMLYSCTM